MATLLDELCKRSRLDCDTMDLDFAKKTGPYYDCTSNQAIAFAEASRTDADGKLVHEDLIKEAVAWAQKAVSAPEAAGESMETLAVEYLVIKLLARFLPYVKGYLLFQINPKFAYDTNKTVATAERIMAMADNIAPEFDAKNRLCFKIVSSWPGLAAAKILEEKGIATLGTALFCMEQASLAGSMGCTYISPYYNELKVHFDKEFRDENKATTLCRDAAAYFAAKSHKTKVKAASFVAADECMHHAGVDYITLFPDIITALAAAPLESMPAADVGKYMAPPSVSPAADWKVLDEAIAAGRGAWEESMAKSAGGESARKLKEAITVFSGMQDNLEALVGKVAMA